MFIKVNTDYTISLLVVDNNGNRITNDLPVAFIKDIQSNTYWNGMFWQGTMAQIILEHIADGVYKTDFTPNTVGIYEITTQSELYGIIRTETIDVYDSEVAKYNWRVGIPFTAKYTRSENAGLPIISICKTDSKLYWDGDSWISDVTEIPMIEISDGVYSYDFTPNEEAEYSMSMRAENGSEIFYILNASLNTESTLPIIINNVTFKSQNGTDSTLVDEKSLAINGVQITCFDMTTKEVVARCLTNVKGEWNMALKPGKYFFVFEKDGYMSVSFERSVI